MGFLRPEPVGDITPKSRYSPAVFTIAPMLITLPALIPWFKLEPWTIPGIGLDIQPFGVLVALGILFGTRIAEWHAEKHGVPAKLVGDFLLFVISIGLPLGMLINMVVYEPETARGWLRGEFGYPGMSSFGGFTAGAGAAFWFRQRRRISILIMGDIFCFAFPFAWLLARSGCFVVHDHPGVVSDFFLAVDNYRLRGQPRHDLGLYEVIWSAAMIPLLLLLQQKKHRAGFYIAFVTLCYAPIRFFLDYLREVPAFGGDIRYGNLTPGQYAAIAMLLVGVALAIRTKRGPQPELYLDGPPPSDDAPEDEPEDKPGETKTRPAQRKKSSKRKRASAGSR